MCVWECAGGGGSGGGGRWCLAFGDRCAKARGGGPALTDPGLFAPRIAPLPPFWDRCDVIKTADVGDDDDDEEDEEEDGGGRGGGGGGGCWGCGGGGEPGPCWELTLPAMFPGLLALLRLPVLLLLLLLGLAASTWPLESRCESRMRAFLCSCASAFDMFSCFFHFVLRFWNQIFTCVSVTFSRVAISALSLEDKYFFCSNCFSSSNICRPVNVVRAFFFLTGQSSPLPVLFTSLSDFLRLSFLPSRPSDDNDSSNLETEHVEMFGVFSRDAEQSDKSLSHGGVTLSPRRSVGPTDRYLQSIFVHWTIDVGL